MEPAVVSTFENAVLANGSRSSQTLGDVALTTAPPFEVPKPQQNMLSMHASQRNPGSSIDMPENADNGLLVIDQSGVLFEPKDTTINIPGRSINRHKYPLVKSIRSLYKQGMYAIPLRLEMEEGKKKAFFNKGGYLALTTSIDAYKQRINTYVCQAQSNVNALAVLCGISDIFMLDIDAEGKPATKTNAGKEAGIKLWEELINKHGDIATLKARTGSGNGLHYLFFASKTEGLPQYIKLCDDRLQRYYMGD